VPSTFNKPSYTSDASACRADTSNSRLKRAAQQL
jgi:hypothetical protein